MSEQPLISICIPVYLTSWDSQRVLCELLQSINEQDYPQDRIRVKLSCQGVQGVSGMQDIIHMTNGVRSPEPQSIINPEGVDGPAKNTNSALSMAESEGYVKIMNQDDFFQSSTAISEMVDVLENSDTKWLVSACVHTDAKGEKRENIHIPSWPGEKGMVEGVNRLGCPSVAMFQADLLPQCDPNLILCMDCDMWIQMVKKAGLPLIYRKCDIVIRMWDEQLSNQIDYARSLETDKIYLRKKYGYA